MIASIVYRLKCPCQVVLGKPRLSSAGAYQVPAAEESPCYLLLRYTT